MSVFPTIPAHPSLLPPDDAPSNTTTRVHLVLIRGEGGDTDRTPASRSVRTA